MTLTTNPLITEINDQIEFIDHEIENLKSLISENHYMNPEQEDELEDLIAKAIKFGELCAQRKHLENSQNLILVPSEPNEKQKQAAALVTFSGGNAIDAYKAMIAIAND